VAKNAWRWRDERRRRGAGASCRNVASSQAMAAYQNLIRFHRGESHRRQHAAKMRCVLCRALRAKTIASALAYQQAWRKKHRRRSAKAAAARHKQWRISSAATRGSSSIRQPGKRRAAKIWLRSASRAAFITALRAQLAASAHARRRACRRGARGGDCKMTHRARRHRGGGGVKGSARKSENSGVSEISGGARQCRQLA